MNIKITKRFIIGAALAALSFSSFQASAGCWSNCSKYKTKHPIVLVHGVAGFNSIFGIDYFYGVRDALTAKGATVYTPNVTAWDDAYERGQQLVEYLEDLQSTLGNDVKFNLMGHSLGGPTIRYAAEEGGSDLVASVTTINAVNFGSDVADVAFGIIPVDGGAAAFIDTALSLMGDITDSLSGNPEYANDALAAAVFMTTPMTNTFNATYSDGKPTSTCGEGAPFVNGVRYYSWGGDMAFTNVFDISDPFLIFTGAVINGSNDGLVERCDQHWGDVISTKYNTNHLDAVNHIFGIHHIFETDPLTLYKNQAVRLKSAGL
jgi:triacylglycerol lipase